MQRVADYSNSLRKVHRILARIMRGWRGWEDYGIDLVITNPRALTLIFTEKWKKWKNASRNLQVGDIVMILYKGNLVDNYRLVKVTQLFPDERNLVRTVEVSYRKRMKKEPNEVYKSKDLVTEKIAVQRLSLLQAVDERLADGEEEGSKVVKK